MKPLEIEKCDLSGVYVSKKRNWPLFLALNHGIVQRLQSLKFISIVLCGCFIC